MYERFTDRARKVMQLANQEALRFNHEHIDSEHILLRLVKEGSGVAANVLKNLGLDLAKIRLDVEKHMRPGPELVATAKLPQTKGAKKVVEYAMDEARRLNHDYVGTEHMLLGLLQQSEGIAAMVLESVGMKLDDVREETLRLLGPSAPPQLSPSKQNVSTKLDDDVPAELQAVAAQFDAKIAQLTREMEEAVAEQDFPKVEALRHRAVHLLRTKQAMLRYWIANAPIDPSWLSWNHGAVVALAQRIQQQYAWKELPSLADHLEVAGCTDAEILTHCRDPREHLYRCWVVDLILSRASLGR